MIRPCECGSLRFAVDAVYAATDYIELRNDGTDGEWDEHSRVRCLECEKIMTYGEWSDQDEPEAAQ